MRKRMSVSAVAPDFVHREGLFTFSLTVGNQSSKSSLSKNTLLPDESALSDNRRLAGREDQLHGATFKEMGKA